MTAHEKLRFWLGDGAGPIESLTQLVEIDLNCIAYERWARSSAG
jgi:hypothetical protein